MLVVLLVLASLASLILGIRYLRQALAVTGTATSYIRSAAQGYVVFVGEGSPLPGHPIVAPFSGKPCVWWATQIDALEPIPPVVNSHAFDRRTSTASFLLKDGTGECLVDPDLAEIHAATKEVWYGNTLVGDSLRNARRERGLEDNCRYVEERIDLHQRIVASGYLRTMHAQSDSDPRRTDGGASTAPGTNMLCPPSDGRRFLLSTVPEDALAQRLRVRAALALLLCAVSGGCALLVH